MAHSEYWLGSNWKNRIPARDSVQYSLMLSSIRRSIAGFVRIVTKEDIKVRFSSGQMSYTDGKVIVISADPAPDKIDKTVGLALHEASHILLSSRLFTPKYQSDFKMKVGDIYSGLPANSPFMGHVEELTKFIHMIVNILEDRRIDSWMYERLGGYRPYYDTLYDEAFFTPEIEAALEDDAFRTPNLKSYQMHLINIHHPKFDKNALPGLAQAYDLADIKHIRRFDADMEKKNTSVLPDITLLAFDIAQVILPHITSLDLAEEQEKTFDDMFGAADEFNDDLENLDQPSGMSKAGISKALKDLEKQIDRLMNHNAEDKTQVTQEQENNISSLEESNTTIKRVGDDVVGKTNVLVHEKITQQSANIFPNITLQPMYSSAVENGIQFGNSLANRIQVLQDEYYMKFGRQERGKLDKRRIASLAVNDPNVFFYDKRVNLEPVLVHLTVDASGSMVDHWDQTVRLFTGLAVASVKNRAFDIIISLRSESYGRAHGNSSQIGVVFDSRRDGLTHIRTIFPYLVPTGGTPEGLTFEAYMEYINKSAKKGTRRFFVNISDGCPSANHYYGNGALNHTRNQVNKIRAEGIQVLSYLIGRAGENDFRYMYGQDASIIDVSSIPQVAKTLNNLFLKGTEDAVF